MYLRAGVVSLSAPLHPRSLALVVRLARWRLVRQVYRALPVFAYLTGCYFYNTAQRLTRRAAGVKLGLQPAFKRVFDRAGAASGPHRHLVSMGALRSFKNSFALRVHGSGERRVEETAVL